MKTIAIIAINLLLIVSVACSKKTDAPADNAIIPIVNISDLSQARAITPSVYRFYVSLDKTYTQTTSIDFTTVAGTAVAGNDFTAKSGTVTFAPGHTRDSIDIMVTGDSLRRADQQFFVQLSHPQSAVVGNGKATGTIVNGDGMYLPTDNSGYSTPLVYAGYTLAWHDEFDGNAINPQNWNFETGGNGWGNQELENYTGRPQNAFASAGNLIIEARKESYQGSQYTSARMTTQHKQEFTYGRIDIRAKLPVLPGMWPALWMLGANINTVPWPACGETDIMELIGKNPKQVVGSFHWQKPDAQEGTINNTVNAPQDFSTQFHVFTLIWAQNQVQMLIDDQPYVTANDQTVGSGYPFNAPFFLLFNVAVGGNWPGPPDNTTLFPQRMYVDYVRVFQK